MVSNLHDIQLFSINNFINFSTHRYFYSVLAGGAFVLAFPIGGLIGARKGPSFALRLAAAIQALNVLILIFLTPESHSSMPEQQQKVDFKEANPVGGLIKLFGRGGLLRTGSIAFFLAQLARNSLDAQFPTYTNLRFGWTQAQSGPVLVLVGLMLAIVPRILVPRLGLRHSIEVGLATFAMGLFGAGLAPSPPLFVGAIALVAVGCVCLPTLQALLVNLANPEERGSLLGAMGAVNELTGAIGSSMYAAILAKFNTGNPPFPLPGFHFMVGSSLLVLAGILTMPGLKTNKDNAALSMGDVTY